mmetsp:Transcript_35412/g.110397  ORF Transcript_35412/g.110397 Transcript_35412/m.110397 type:complete len:316 (+) Transcript_35412:722-1669(+)
MRPRVGDDDVPQGGGSRGRDPADAPGQGRDPALRRVLLHRPGLRWDLAERGDPAAAAPLRVRRLRRRAPRGSHCAGLRHVQRAGSAPGRREAALRELQPPRPVRRRHGARHCLRGQRAARGAQPAPAPHVGRLGLRAPGRNHRHGPPLHADGPRQDGACEGLPGEAAEGHRRQARGRHDALRRHPRQRRHGRRGPQHEPLALLPVRGAAARGSHRLLPLCADVVLVPPHPHVLPDADSERAHRPYGEAEDAEELLAQVRRAPLPLRLPRAAAAPEEGGAGQDGGGRSLDCGQGQGASGKEGCGRVEEQGEGEDRR